MGWGRNPTDCVVIRGWFKGLGQSTSAGTDIRQLEKDGFENTECVAR